MAAARMRHHCVLVLLSSGGGFPNKEAIYRYDDLTLCCAELSSHLP